MGDNKVIDLIRKYENIYNIKKEEVHEWLKNPNLDNKDNIIALTSEISMIDKFIEDL